MTPLTNWHYYRHEQVKRREKRLPGRIREIIGCEKNGFVVTRLTEYQYRINEQLDFYPLHRRWHDIKTNERGDYKNALNLCRERLA
ncbi:MAG: hypothetical protein UMS36scaffold28_73 [Phage 59_13]|nr:MAG: hypothetical protein UMS36scaffold28_73 [Phage 59_13]